MHGVRKVRPNLHGYWEKAKDKYLCLGELNKMASFVYDSAKEYIADGSIDLKDHSFKVMLLSASHTPSKSGDSVKADVVAEEISGDGYTAGGGALATTFSRAAAVVKFDAPDPVFIALVPDWRYAVVYDDTHASDALVALLDPLALQEPGGINIRLNFDAAGIVTLTDG
jgi:hypothetical protein